jgi:hypothetical protein
MLLRLATVLLFASLLLISCGVNIEYGQTEEEAIETSERRASQSRTGWAQQLSRTPEAQWPRAVAHLIDTTASRYVDFGRQIDNEWRQAEDGLGREVTASEMMDVIGKWTSRDQPILDAWDDNIVHGLETVKQDGKFDRVIVDLLEAQFAQFQKLSSAVLYPSSSRTDYLDRVLKETEDLKYIGRELILKLDLQGY